MKRMLFDLAVRVQGSPLVYARTLEQVIWEINRKGEIGVRMALGAQPYQVLRAIVGEGLRLVLAGLLIGAAGSWAVMRGLQSLLYGVTPADAWILAGSALVLLLVGAGASYAPAHQAATIDPLAALRHE